MAASLEKLHIDAGLAPIRSTGLTVYPDPNGFVPDEIAPPYVRVYTSVEVIPLAGTADALDGNSATWVTSWYCHCVGGNEYAAADLAAGVRAALLNVTPAIAGRACGKFRKQASQPTQRDESTGTAVYDRVDVYMLTTAPG